MKFAEFKIPVSQSKTVGREYNHLEDLVFINGSQGVKKAIAVLENLGHEKLAVKWDGNPTIYWGRDSNGKFIMVNKNGWGREKTYEAEQLKEFIVNTGKQESWRKQFAENMATVHRVLESATPKHFRGFVYGDLLWYPAKTYQKTNEEIEFTPNLVTYKLSSNSRLGQRIKESKVGVVVHQHLASFGDKNGSIVSNISDLNNQDAVVIGQTYVNNAAQSDRSAISCIQKQLSQYAESIDDFLQTRQGLSDIKDIIYRYVNQTSRNKQLDTLGENFFVWLESSKVSKPKQKRIHSLAESNPTALPAIFSLVKDIMSAKNQIISQLDESQTEIKAVTKGVAGGEGYVALESKIKFVPRHRWQPF